MIHCVETGSRTDWLYKSTHSYNAVYLMNYVFTGLIESILCEIKLVWFYCYWTYLTLGFEYQMHNMLPIAL